MNLRYENTASFAITIDLSNGYSVLAMAKYNKDASNYTSEYYLKDNQIDYLDCMNDLAKVFECDATTIKSEILKYIASKLDAGELDGFIARYDWYQKCFSVGCDAFDYTE